MLSTGSLPDFLNESHIIQILTPHEQSSYRPIACLTPSIRSKLSSSRHDSLMPLTPNFFPFNSDLERDYGDGAERGGRTLYMLALDYSRAFDAIPDPKMMEASGRHGIGPQLLALINAIYTAPRFTGEVPSQNLLVTNDLGGDVFFTDGTKVKKVDTLIYLGAALTIH
eukprot:5769738-Amphidinium_carterae.1